MRQNVAHNKAAGLPAAKNKSGKLGTRITLVPAMDFTALIQNPVPVLFEGAMGTELERRGATMGGKSNLSHPDTVLAIHRDYQRCGCAVLMTNTLTMNRVLLWSDPDAVDIRAVNLAGARLAREVAGADGYVLGNIGSTGKLLKPYGPLDESEASAAFAEQAGLLREGGVNGFIIETMMDLREAVCALTACRAYPELPVLVTIAFKTAKNDDGQHGGGLRGKTRGRRRGRSRRQLWRSRCRGDGDRDRRNARRDAVAHPRQTKRRQTPPRSRQGLL
jgi:hypothetical protein